VRKVVNKNAEKTEAIAKKLFPDEEWIEASSIEFKNKGKGIGLPRDLKGINIAQSRLTGKKGDEVTLSKEIRQAKILTDKGDIIYFIPKAKDENGNDIRGPDAILNGIPYEFKTVDGSIDKVESNFRYSRKQSENVFLRITDKNITKDEVLSKIHNVLNNPSYTGGTNGCLLVHFEGTNQTHKYILRSLK